MYRREGSSVAGHLILLVGWDWDYVRGGVGGVLGGVGVVLAAHFLDVTYTSPNNLMHAICND